MGTEFLFFADEKVLEIVVMFVYYCEYKLKPLNFTFKGS